MPLRALRRPTLKLALLVNQTPILLFGALILGATVVMLIEIGDQGVRLIAGLRAGTLTAADIEAQARAVRSAWLGSLGAFLVMLVSVAALSRWVYGRLVERLGSVVDYTEHRMAGRPVVALPQAGDDVLGRVERAIVAASDAAAERAVELEQQSDRNEFEAQMQRAFELASTEAQTLDVVHRAMKEILPEEAVQILLADSSQAHLRSMPGSAPGCEVESPAACAAVRQGTPIVFPSSELLDSCPMLRDRGAPCSSICSPLTVMGRTVGVLHISGSEGITPSSWRRRELAFLAKATGNRLSVLRTLAGAQLQASTDPLTGLLNRRSFEDQAARVLSEQGEDEHSVVMCDLDHFKDLNDTAGHQAGDRALQLFSGLLKSTLRSEDIIGRHGGEEFVMLLPGCDPDQGALLIERLRAALREAVGNYEGPPFTASFGLAGFSRDGADVPDLIRAADRALYAAKNAGRDRLVRITDLKAAASA